MTWKCCRIIPCYIVIVLYFQVPLPLLCPTCAARSTAWKGTFPTTVVWQWWFNGQFIICTSINYYIAINITISMSYDLQGINLRASIMYSWCLKIGKTRPLIFFVNINDYIIRSNWSSVHYYNVGIEWKNVNSYGNSWIKYIYLAWVVPD